MTLLTACLHPKKPWPKNHGFFCFIAEAQILNAKDFTRRAIALFYDKRVALAHDGAYHASLGLQA